MNATSIRAAAVLCAGCIAWGGEQFRPLPLLIGIATAALVRVPLWKPRSKWLAEASFTLLGMVGAGTTIVSYRIGLGPSFWCGIAFGAGASSALEIGKSMVDGAIKDRFQAAARVLFGIKGA